MKKEMIRKFACLACVILLILSVSGCSLNSYSVDELKELYPKAIENSLSEELYYWKETVNASDHNSWRTCNVYAEMDKKFNVIRDENGECSNMKVDVFEEHNGKVVKFSFAVKDDYTDRYKTESGKASIFEGAKYATIELSYDRFASIVVYDEEKLGKNISADKEIYKLETVYYGPKIDIPSYDSGVWAETAK